MQMNLALHAMGGVGWTGGQIVLRNLCHSLRHEGPRELRTSLLVADELPATRDYARAIEVDDVLVYHRPRQWTPRWGMNELTRRLWSRDFVIEGALKEHDVSVVFGPNLVDKYHRIATLAWLCDFQHIRLPSMFSAEERMRRDSVFQRCARSATRIIVATESSRKDFASFAPRYVGKVRALHSISCIPDSIYHSDLGSLLKVYHLPEKFVYLPNQFWKHKNHEIVFRAVKGLKDRGVKICVVCTGNPVDYRHPTYLADLFERLSRWNLRGEVLYLGLIPHDHVLMLMRQSLCVMNPSLFEGWGITVDEARSLGKRVLLSDIAAHRDQSPSQATFFDPQDCDDLMEQLGEIWRNGRPGPDVELEAEARRELPGRLSAYAEAFTAVAREAVEEVGNRLTGHSASELRLTRVGQQ
jgi:glycosyltransferase involved in cell wall biosynthesis